MRSWCLNVNVFSNVTSRVYDLFSGTKEKRGKRYLFEEVVYCSLSRAAFINVLQQILRFEDPFIRFNQFFHLFGLTNFLGAIFYRSIDISSILRPTENYHNPNIVQLANLLVFKD